MIIEKEYKSEGLTKSLDIQLSNGDDLRIYDDGDGYCTIIIDRHEDYTNNQDKKISNSEVRTSNRVVKLNTSGVLDVCRVEEIAIQSNVKLGDITNIQVRHFDWE